jgi:hypothetical protein
MNSSANQISPIGQSREMPPPVTLFPIRQVSLPGPAASGAEYAVNVLPCARWKAWADAARERQKSNCVKGVIGCSPLASAALQAGPEVAVNAVCMRACIFIKNLGLKAKL